MFSYILKIKLEKFFKIYKYMLKFFESHVVQIKQEVHHDAKLQLKIKFLRELLASKEQSSFMIQYPKLFVVCAHLFKKLDSQMDELTAQTHIEGLNYRLKHHTLQGLPYETLISDEERTQMVEQFRKLRLISYANQLEDIFPICVGSIVAEYALDSYYSF